MKQIEITVSPTGEATLRTTGFVGSECQRASRFLEEGLGVKLSDQKTADFYQVTTARQSVQEGAR